MVYFTADLHLGHANIIGHCGRPFASVEEMDRVLLQNGNDRVRPTDTVYILGDLIFRSKAPAADYLEQMPGRKHLITGNHDAGWMKKTELDRYFESVSLMAEIREGGHRLVLCHYPMMSWPHIMRCYMVFAHVLGIPQGGPNLCGVDGAAIPAAQQRGLCAGGRTPGAERYRPVRGK